MAVAWRAEKRWVFKLRSADALGNGQAQGRRAYLNARFRRKSAPYLSPEKPIYTQVHWHFDKTSLTR